jgi:hypothetical protein
MVVISRSEYNRGNDFNVVENLKAVAIGQPDIHQNKVNAGSFKERDGIYDSFRPFFKSVTRPQFGHHTFQFFVCKPLIFYYQVFHG